MNDSDFLSVVALLFSGPHDPSSLNGDDNTARCDGVTLRNGSGRGKDEPIFRQLVQYPSPCPVYKPYTPQLSYNPSTCALDHSTFLVSRPSTLASRGSFFVYF